MRLTTALTHPAPMNTDLQTETQSRGCVQRLVRHSVEWTIEKMIATYPGLFWSRTLALHHLFVVLGCGYEWKGGKLIDRSPKVKDRIPREAARILAQHRIRLQPGDAYPWSDLCNLATMPADVDDDWKAAADEARADMPNSVIGTNSVCPNQAMHRQKTNRSVHDFACRGP